MERRMEGHVWYELCKQLLKYVRLWMCVCVCVCVFAPEAPGDWLMEQMVAAGRGRRNRLAATAGGQRAPGEGCFIWAPATHAHTHTHTHTHTPSVKPSPHPPPPNTQCAAMPQKQKDAPRKTFHLQIKLAEAGQKKQDSFHLSHLRVCVCASELQLCVCDLRRTET